MAPGFEEYFARTAINLSPALFGRAAEALADFGERRLSAMDQIGVEKAVLSLAGPGVQAETDTRVAGREASEVNDFLAERMRANPARYGGFAHLAMQDPRAAADELERCVRDLGMQGAWSTADQRRVSRRRPLRGVLGAGGGSFGSGLHPPGQPARRSSASTGRLVHGMRARSAMMEIRRIALLRACAPRAARWSRFRMPARRRRISGAQAAPRCSRAARSTCSSRIHSGMYWPWSCQVRPLTKLPSMQNCSSA